MSLIISRILGKYGILETPAQKFKMTPKQLTGVEYTNRWYSDPLWDLSDTQKVPKRTHFPKNQSYWKKSSWAPKVALVTTKTA